MKLHDFLFYFDIGWKHILSWDATDHILFIAALSIVYTHRDIKKILILVTAFTIGHAATLYLTAFDYLRFNVALVEMLIPCTILLTALSNIFFSTSHRKGMQLHYAIALFFGLIHGMGYANYIRFLLSSDQQLVWSLFSFNLGLEIGQLVIVSGVLLFNWLWSTQAWISQRISIVLVSGFIAVVSIFLIISR
ncbi:MAG: HupE/UreJ family protein [Bacteroidota bacterium]